MVEKVLFTWSGGKDSAMALYELVMDGSYEIVVLLTTVTEDYNRISMHGVRDVLLERQASSLRIPLEKIYIPSDSSNDEYERRMREKLEHYRLQGVSSVVFGDLYLEDVREYRERNLAQVGMEGIFPLWGRDTKENAQQFADLGFEAILTCVDSSLLDCKFAGRVYNGSLLNELPAGVDPCGENGEFHTFVYDGPIFRERISCRKGEIVLRDNRFNYCDLLPLPDKSDGL